jgi:uncharacterized protein (TIGR03000 family)
MNADRKNWFVLAGAGTLGLIVLLVAARIHSVRGQRDAESSSEPRYTVGMTEGFNLVVTDNNKNALYFYTADEDKPVGSDLKLRGTIDLRQVGKLTIRPISEGEDSTKKATTREATKKGTMGAGPERGARAPAYITVVVPDDAVVSFDGEATTLTGGKREFISPPLEKGRKYRYEVTAQWTANGKQVEQKRKVPVTSGERVRVDFLTAESK